MFVLVMVFILKRGSLLCFIVVWWMDTCYMFKIKKVCGDFRQK